MEENISNNKFKKIEKKLKKLQHTIFKEVGIECSTDKISKILVTANAGLVSGLTEEVVYNYFSKYGTLEHILLLPGKSCSFLQYKDDSSAVSAYNNYNGTLNIAQNSKPVYLLYGSQLPDVKLNTTWTETVPGLIILENFVTTEEEDILLTLCKFESNCNSQLKNRQVKHFGFEFRYDTNNVDKDKPLCDKIPEECNFWERLKTTEFKNFIPDQLTINHYLPGQGIPQHVDTHSAFEDPIMALSLQSSLVMEFKKEDTHISILLPQRSLAIMSGECRYDWTHGITPRKLDIVLTPNGFTSLERGTRVSFTFRKILQGECSCNYKSKCDSFNKNVEKTKIQNKDASKLEEEHVHKVYESIAEHFDDTRHKPWPNVLNFLESFEFGSVLVDVGCGNGKYLGKNKNIFDIGCDTSFNLIDICNHRGFEAFIANCLTLPLKDNSVDGAISIAVIHHLANEDRRISAIREITRILKIGGKALIYVWAKDQHKDQEKTTYLKQDRKNRKKEAKIVTENVDEELCIMNNVTLPVHINRTQFKHEDLLVPWKLKGDKNEDKLATNTFLRYYHVFNENELEGYCNKLNNVEIIKSYYDQGNWCIIINKIS